MNVVSSRDRTDLLCHFQKQMLTLSQQKKEELLNALLSEDLDTFLDRENLEILQRVLISIEGNGDTSVHPSSY